MTTTTAVTAINSNNVNNVSNSTIVHGTIRKNQLLASIPNFGKPYKTFNIQLHDIELYFSKSSSMNDTIDGLELKSTTDIAQPTSKQSSSSSSSSLLMTTEWNKSYNAAQQIFSNTTQSKLIRTAIHVAHGRLYVGTIGITPTKNVTIQNSTELLTKIFKVNKNNNNTIEESSSTKNNNKNNNNINAGTNKNSSDVLYTYVILPNGDWRFSKTHHPNLDAFLTLPFGTAIDFMSKHALMADCSTEVVYAGEFYIKKVALAPVAVTSTTTTTNGKMDDNDDDVNNFNHYVLVIDNGSGTYAPGTSNGQLDKLSALLKRNFPGLNVLARHYEDPVTDEMLVQAIVQ